MNIYCKNKQNNEYHELSEIDDPLESMNDTKNNISSKWYYKDDGQEIINGPLGYVTGIDGENITFSNRGNDIFTLNSKYTGIKRHWFTHLASERNNIDLSECLDKARHDELIYNQLRIRDDAEANGNINTNYNGKGGKSSRRKRKSRKTKRRSKLRSKRRR